MVSVRMVVVAVFGVGAEMAMIGATTVHPSPELVEAAMSVTDFVRTDDAAASGAGVEAAVIGVTTHQVPSSIVEMVRSATAFV